MVMGDIEALSIQELSVEAAVKDRCGKYKDFNIDIELMKNLFLELREMDSEEMETYLLAKLPLKVKLTVLGSTVTDVEEIGRDLVDDDLDMELNLET
jgi:hypothetical protein